jgi:cysteine desulfurase
LAPAVESWLAKGDLLWANPSSQHQRGKRAQAALDTARRSLYTFFGFNDKTHSLTYHSGATEGINTFVLGHWLKAASSGNSLLYIYSPLDHACSRLQAARLKGLGFATVELLIDRQGNLQLEESIQAINEARARVSGDVLMNYTWVHNETGVVWPLDWARTIKERTQCIVHVDAAQAIGKVANCWELLTELDMYSFSSHKCGALRGHGWSFTRKDYTAWPLILGGGQQESSRSGTENVLAALALNVALDEMKQHWKPAEQLVWITELRGFMDEALQGKGERVAREARELNLNTVMFVIDALPSDMSLPLFDLAGLEVSAGAACSSGAAKPNHILESLAFKDRTKNGLRLSTSWSFSSQQWNELRPRLKAVLEKLPRK